MQSRVVLGNRPHSADRAAAVLEPARDDAVARSPHPAPTVLIVNHVGARRPTPAVEGSPPAEGPGLDRRDILGHLGFIEQMSVVVDDEEFLLG